MAATGMGQPLQEAMFRAIRDRLGAGRRRALSPATVRGGRQRTHSPADISGRTLAAVQHNVPTPATQEDASRDATPQQGDAYTPVPSEDHVVATTNSGGRYTADSN